MRLNKFLAQAGFSSRRGADLLIQSGRVTVNGVKVKKLGILIDEKKDEIRLNGKRVHLPKKFIYILLNKPKGYLCTVKDSFGRPTVLDLVGKDKSEFGSCGKVFPVGRLDLDTEGILLLTNEGELAYRLTHPKFQVEKTYLVTVKGKINEKILKRFHKGIKLEDGKIAKGEAKILKIEKGTSVLELKLREGRKREIKRMSKAVGLSVTNLVRIKFANLSVSNLKSGAWRYLKEKEIGDLKKMVRV
ncbi:MAG: pseudouridine synthase [Candidatus Zixiibacteriota bacterium]